MDGEASMLSLDLRDAGECGANDGTSMGTWDRSAERLVPRDEGPAEKTGDVSARSLRPRDEATADMCSLVSSDSDSSESLDGS